MEPEASIQGRVTSASGRPRTENIFHLTTKLISLFWKHLKDGSEEGSRLLSEEGLQNSLGGASGGVPSPGPLKSLTQLSASNTHQFPSPLRRELFSFWSCQRRVGGGAVTWARSSLLRRESRGRLKTWEPINTSLTRQQGHVGLRGPFNPRVYYSTLWHEDTEGNEEKRVKLFHARRDASQAEVCRSPRQACSSPALPGK